VGRTGSGKTTLLMALFRMFELTYGRIIIDGLNIAAIPLHTVRLPPLVRWDSNVFCFYPLLSWWHITYSSLLRQLLPTHPPLPTNLQAWPFLNVHASGHPPCPCRCAPG